MLCSLPQPQVSSSAKTWGCFWVFRGLARPHRGLRAAPISPQVGHSGLVRPDSSPFSCRPSHDMTRSVATTSLSRPTAASRSANLRSVRSVSAINRVSKLSICERAGTFTARPSPGTRPAASQVGRPSAGSLGRGPRYVHRYDASPAASPGGWDAAADRFSTATHS